MLQGEGLHALEDIRPSAGLGPNVTRDLRVRVMVFLVSGVSHTWRPTATELLIVPRYGVVRGHRAQRARECE